MTVELEICVDDLAGVHAAVAGGADRVELCAALEIGGLTPSAGLLAAALPVTRAAGVALHAMVRPRGGDFAYDDAALAVAFCDAARIAAAGVDGMVFGAARDGSLDTAVLARFVGSVRDAGFTGALTLHRAVDAVDDPVAAVDAAVALGFDRILTSGGAASASAGAPVIAAMAARAAGRCRIMAGAGIRPDTVAALVAATAIRDVHASASVAAAMPDFRAAALGFAPQPRATDSAIVAALRAALDRPAGAPDAR